MVVRGCPCMLYAVCHNLHPDLLPTATWRADLRGGLLVVLLAEVCRKLRALDKVCTYIAVLSRVFVVHMTTADFG